MEGGGKHDLMIWGCMINFWDESQKESGIPKKRELKIDVESHEADGGTKIWGPEW